MASLAQTIKISVELRPCYVDGKKALFHKWAQKDDIIVKTDGFFVSMRGIKEIKLYKKGGTLQKKYENIKISKTIGIVEYADGTIAEVAPTNIKFADNEIQKYAFMPMKK